MLNIVCKSDLTSLAVVSLELRARIQFRMGEHVIIFAKFVGPIIKRTDIKNQMCRAAAKDIKINRYGTLNTLTLLQFSGAM